MIEILSYSELVEKLDKNKMRHFSNVNNVFVQRAIINTYQTLKSLEKDYKIKRIKFATLLQILDGIAIPLKDE